ncbi:MAG: lectin-like protein [Myxococcota bacterium]
MFRSILILAALGACNSTSEPTDNPLGTTIPLVDRVVVGPENPLRADVLTAQVEIVPAGDGEDVTLAYEWVVNGDVVGTGSTLGPDVVQAGEEVWVNITPSDASDVGETVRSNTVVGGNNPPDLTAVDIAPVPLKSDDLATATIDASDWDGQNLSFTYEWFVNGVSRTNTPTLDGRFSFVRGDSVYVAVVADDGFLFSDRVQSEPLMVVNGAPSAPDLGTAPEKPAAGEAVVCTIEQPSRDADGDPVEYRFWWTLDGSPMTNTSTTTWADDTAQAGSWAEGQSLVCHVEASDGTDVSPTATIDVAGIRPPCLADDATVMEDGEGRTYVICDERRDWAGAEAQCQSMGEAWHLASIRSAAENAFLTDALVGTVVNGAGNPFCWVGYTDADSEGNWVWTDGDASTYVNWIDPEPNGGDSQNCVMFRGGDTWNGTWNDIGCENLNPYVCTRAD